MLAGAVCVFGIVGPASAQEDAAVSGEPVGFAELLYGELQERAALVEGPDPIFGSGLQGGVRRRRGKFPPRRTQTITEEFLTPPPEEVLYSIPPNASLGYGVHPHAPRLKPREKGAALDSVTGAFGLWDDSGWEAFGMDNAEILNFVTTEGAAIELRKDPVTDEYDIIEVTGGQQLKINETTASADHVLVRIRENESIWTGNVKLDNPMIHAEADRFRFDGVDSEEAFGEGAEPEAEILAHPLVPAGYIEKVRSGEIPLGRYEARNLDLIDRKRTLYADFLDFDTETKTGTLIDARGSGLPFYFSAGRLEFTGPRDAIAEDVWITTCDHEIPHYRLRLSRLEIKDGVAMIGENSSVQLGRSFSFFFLPRLDLSLLEDRRTGIDIDLGRESKLGYFFDLKYWMRVNDQLRMAPRFMPTTDEGIGVGLNGEYDYLNTPSKPWLFRAKGEWETLYTTQERGYAEWYHRQELTPDTILLGRIEAWSDDDFLLDYFPDEFFNQSGPRSFANITHVGPDYLLSGTTSVNLNSFIDEAERLPEVAYRIPERHLAENLYFANDAAAGYYQRSLQPIDSTRLYEDARLSYDWQPAQGLNVTPFAGLGARYYSTPLIEDADNGRLTGVGGTTVQGRIQKAYGGLRRYSGFKHIVVPSVTYSYEKSTGLDRADIPQFDPADDRQDRSRIESRLDNVLLARNAENGESWQIARLSLYHGTDFNAERAEADDFEVEATLRPRPWWGFNGVYKTHQTDAPAGDPDQSFDRVATQIFYDNEVGSNTLNAAVGFNMLKTAVDTFGREFTYGVGYRVNENWSFSAFQAYDIDLDEITRQEYQIRRRMHRWEVALRISDRASGFGLRLEFNLIDFPSTKLKF